MPILTGGVDIDVFTRSDMAALCGVAGLRRGAATFTVADENREGDAAFAVGLLNLQV